MKSRIIITGLLAVSNSLLGQQVVVPNSSAANEAPGYTLSFSQDIRSQQIYASSEFPSTPIKISAVKLRRDSTSQPFENANATVRIKVSTTPKSVDGLDASFANNIGSDEVTVFDGVLTVSSPSTLQSGLNPFEIVVPFTTPFDYDPSQGNLLIDHKVIGSSTIPRIDGEGLVGDGVSRAFATDSDATAATSVDTGADIVLFDYVALDSTPFFTKVTQSPVVSDGASSLSAAWADIDENGLLDLVVPNLPGNNFLYRNLGNGSFEPAESNVVNLSGGDSTSVAFGDYDNDGMVDLFVGNRGQDHFLHRGLDNFSFANVTDQPVTDGGPQSYQSTLVDYDSDGNLDVFTVNIGTENQLYRNNGDGSFSVDTSTPLTASSSLAVGSAWGDYDNDGLMDVFIPQSQGTADLLFRNIGNGSFSQILTGDPVSDSGGGLAASWADYDNDGDLDLFVTNRDGVNFLYRNDVTVFVKITSGDIVTDNADSNGAAWGDFDNDGWLDLFVANGDTPANQADYLYRNLGDGTFERITVGPMVTDLQYSAAPVWVDIDSDGALDLFVASANSNNALYRNSGTTNHWLTARLSGVTSNRSAIGARMSVTATIGAVTLTQQRTVSGGGGFDGQNLELHFGLGDATVIDEIRINWPSGAVQILENIDVDQRLTLDEQNTGAWPNFTQVKSGEIATDSQDSAGATWGDIDNDGWEDLYVANFRQLDAMYLNNQDGTFTKQTDVAPVQTANDALAATFGDIDNDGDLDLFVSDKFDDRLYQNNGGGTWALRSSDPTGQDGLVSLGAAWGDYDNDGLIDLAVAMGGGAASIQNRLYKNLGNASFTRVTTGAVASSSGYNISASWADYDDDGNLDLLLTGDNLLFRNSPGGNFSNVNSTPISTVTGFPHGAGWADFDNDGDLDVVIVNMLGNPTLYRNEGGGEFSATSIAAFSGFSAIGLHWGDFDLDGFIDVAMARRSQPLSVFRNNGNGEFSVFPLPDVPDNFGNTVSWVDYDNDGDLDLFLARGGDSGVTNNRQNLLLKNSGLTNSWLSVVLNGSVSNKKGVGAIVRVTAQIDGESRQQLRQVGGGDSLGGTTLVAHFGLGNATIIDELRIEWPSGLNQTLNNIVPDQILEIAEDGTSELAFSPTAGTFTNSVLVSIYNPVPAGDVRYTLNGNDPESSSPLYVAPLLLTADTTVKARLFVNGFPASEILTGNYVLYIPPDIEFQPASQLFTNQVTVTLINNVGAGLIRYTTDSSTPSSTSPSYLGPLALTAETVVTARVFVNTFPVSDVFTKTYSRVYAFEDDGIPFTWRETHFGPGFLTDPRAAADADSDGDGYTNTDEFNEGTIPVDSESAPSIELAVRSIPELTFTTLPQKTYNILRATSLDNPVWEIIVPSVVATGTELIYIDEDAPDNSFYQIELVTE